ncbi:MAG: hypothetical protein QOK42_513 [Frankiaceae bacterium]|jgi:RNA polymerase sigma-70 factor (ECF subfamily)|nr:hypothetical protein [Frankiaceae bacterium]
MTLVHAEGGLMVRAERWPADLVACYEQHVGPLTGYLVTLVGDRALAQDLAQEAFVRVFARWRRVEHPRAYVYLTGINLARQHWRKRGRETAAYSSAEALRDEATPEHDPWLRDLVERLPKRLRHAVLLHYYADLPIEQVSAALHIPVGTTKRRLHEARALLRDILEDPHA